MAFFIAALIYCILSNDSMAEPVEDEKVTLLLTATNYLTEISTLVKQALGENRLGEYVYYDVGDFCFRIGRAAEAVELIFGQTEDTKTMEKYCATAMTQETAVSVSMLAQRILKAVDQQISAPKPIQEPVPVSYISAPIQNPPLTTVQSGSVAHHSHHASKPKHSSPPPKRKHPHYTQHKSY